MTRQTAVKIRGLELLNNVLRRTSSFDTEKPAFHSRLEQIWRNAADAFIRAAMQDIKVQTGMSAASYLALSRKIKRPGATALIDAIIAEGIQQPQKIRGIPTFPSGARRRVGDTDAGRLSGFQSKQAGDQVGKKAYRFRTGSTSLFRFEFNFQTVVWQHAFHDTEVQTMVNGFAAFEDFVKAELGPLGLTVLAEWFGSGKKLDFRTPKINGIRAKTTTVRF